MSRYVEEELVEEQDIDNVCAHWDEFHACGMAVISECRVEVQAVWDSLRLQSENLRFHGNLYEVCRAREQSSQHRLTGSSATRVQTKTGCIALALVIGGALIVRAEL
ncbi:NRN1A protein, partial [Atractosteus spatula]|nr:NRN1A protein [Atractosteus spatula]